MNKKFIYLNKEEVAVTDEYGNITVRDVEGSMHKVLVAEDRLEKLDEAIDNLNFNIKEEISLINIIAKWYRVIGIVDVAALVVAPICLGLLSGLTAAGAVVLLSGLACCGAAAIQNKAYKQIAGFKSEVKKAVEIKKEVEKELDNHRVVNDVYSVSNAMVGDVVEVDSEKDLDRQRDRLKRAYNSGYKNKNKVKQLVLDKR